MSSRRRSPPTVSCPHGAWVRSTTSRRPCVTVSLGCARALSFPPAIGFGVLSSTPRAVVCARSRGRCSRERPSSTSDRQRRLATLALDRLLSPAACDSAPDLADAVGARRLPRRDRQLVRHLDHRRLAARAASLPGCLCALPEPRLCLPVSDRRPVSRLHRAGRQLSRRCPHRGFAPAKSLEDVLPSVSGASGVPARQCLWRSAVGRSLPRLVCLSG